MTARDEASSFSIFSSLNGRGMDLSVVDKLKAEMLQVRQSVSQAGRRDSVTAGRPARQTGIHAWHVLMYGM